MSPSYASMSVASTRRSTFRPETLISRSSTTRRSPLPRTSIYLDITEHQATASTRQQAEFPLCGKLGSSGTSLTKVSADYDSGASPTSTTETCADMDRERVVSSLFGSATTEQRGSSPKRCANIWSQATPPQNPWTERRIARRTSGSAKKIWSRGRRGGEKLGNEKFGYCCWWDQSGVWISTITARSCKSMGRSGSKRDKNQLVRRIGIEKKTFPRRSCKRLPRNWRFEKNLLRRSKWGKSSQNWWIVCASREESYDCESIVDSNSRLQNKIPCQMRENIYDPEQRVALERPTFPVKRLLFRVPGPCLAAILACSNCGYLSERFLKIY